ncbi:MAG: transcriptional regulator [Gemmatales bacterium]|nr:MAG: transcriptional regulator [Gemmatales bacterium]
MHISRAALYCMYALVHMAQLASKLKDGLVPAHEIAAKEGIPRGFLMRLMGQLAKNRIVHSIKGPNGGYRLARPAKDITLLEIIECVDGALIGELPVDNFDNEIGKKLRHVYQEVVENARKQLQRIKLADLAKAK